MSMALHNQMADRMGRALAIAERIQTGADDMGREEIKKEAFAIMAYMFVDLDVELTQEDINKMYREIR